MDPKKIKEELTKLRDSDAPAEVIAEHEALLARKVGKALKGKAKKWDKMNNCWVEDPEGIEPEEASEAPSVVNITLHIGG
jgi:uncharacterized protein YhaN